MIVWINANQMDPTNLRRCKSCQKMEIHKMGQSNLLPLGRETVAVVQNVKGAVRLAVICK
jgi:hypothetical protein